MLLLKINAQQVYVAVERMHSNFLKSRFRMRIFFPSHFSYSHCTDIAVSELITVYLRITLNIHDRVFTSLLKLFPYIRVANHSHKKYTNFVLKNLSVRESSNKMVTQNHTFRSPMYTT